MVRSNVVNPFKERRSVWAQYVTTSLSCLAVLWVVSILLKPSPPRKEMNLRWSESPLESNEYSGAADDDEQVDDKAEEPIFPDVTLDEYSGWLNSYYKGLEFEIHPDLSTRQLTKDILEKSLEMGCDNMVANMRPEGNFNYQYNFVEKVLDDDDMAVRQAGALWGLSMCWQYRPDNHMWHVAVDKGIDFYASHMADGDGFRYLAYPGETDSESGGNALLGLALIEYLRTVKDNNIQVDATRIEKVKGLLKDIIEFLKFMQMKDQHFSQGYRMDQKRKRNYSSPYFDGETMLCFIKAAKYIDGYQNLIPIIESAAPVMARKYTVSAWREEHDSDETKGFYQWSSMLFTEYYEARYKDYELFGDYVIVLGHWIIHTHGILDRQKNTGYAYEGIVSAYTVAKARGHNQARDDFAFTIDNGLYKLIQWQVGGPLAHENSFLVENPTEEKIAIGGIMNGRKDPTIRIDTTQHQLHSLMLASSLVYS
ncbi:hypothetical protein IV203_019296 [Nitzschia inconspicua]|uniref:Uncharacterized protein n=1 Tax=Nitzschia inconspicua TaxID=303405 RepID=A0A9K3M238_9STRA|nr:hypothetical protein IV203_019296 [Nitzschia inconspicua]